MGTIAIARDRAFDDIAETAVRNYCREVHEITYIEHGADNLIVVANRELVFRFPRDEGAAKRLYFETALLQKIAGKVTAVAIPHIVEIKHQPLFVVAKYIEGVHLDGDEIKQLNEEEQVTVGQVIGDFITQLNAAVSGPEVQRLRAQAGVSTLKEPWEQYFERLFVYDRLPNTKLRPIIDEFYPLWKSYIKQEQRVYTIHDDLHPVNLLFMGSKLRGILDFGDANSGGIEEELRWLYLMGNTVLKSAIARYYQHTGVMVDYNHVRVWAIMHQLSTYTNGLARQETELLPFKRASATLRAWLPNFPL